MKIRAGDVVKVISGNKNIKGTVSKVVAVDRKCERVTLEKGLVHKKHLKREKSRKNPEGGIIELPVSIHVSNVMLMSEALGRPVRAGSMDIEGVKTRIARGKGASGERI